MATHNHQQAIHIAETIEKTFNANEYKTLCFRLGLDAEQFPTSVDLVTYHIRRALLDRLLEECESLRPNVQWRLPVLSAAPHLAEAASIPTQATPDPDYPIFLSYAPIDNQPLASNSAGWVSGLVTNLQFFLNQLSGQENRYPIWWDVLLSGNVHRAKQTQRHLMGAKVFVLVLSPAYVQNARCVEELNEFIRYHGTEANQIFIVELRETQRPPSIAHLDVTGFQFWQRDNVTQKVQVLGQLNAVQDPVYLDKVETLAQELWRYLDRELM